MLKPFVRRTRRWSASFPDWVNRQTESKRPGKDLNPDWPESSHTATLSRDWLGRKPVGQSYKCSTFVKYDSRVMQTNNM